ncbi:hypothetical protein [Blastococcus sp. SYSU D00813]
MVLAAVLVLASACGGDSGASPEGSDPAAATLSPAGTPLTAGLVVPVGTQLVGPVFPRTSDLTARNTGVTADAGSVAVLRVDGDPFAAWDDLAGQARDIGVRVPGSGICGWLVPVATPEFPENRVPVSHPRPADSDGMSCEAAVLGTLADGTDVYVRMELWWWPVGAELHVDVSGVSANAFPGYRPVTDPGTAPATAVEQLPARAVTPPVEVGDPFGLEFNCFERGYDRLTVPAGSRLVGGGTVPGFYDFAAVLAVEDAEAVLAELRDQLDDPDDSSGSYGLGEERLTDGTPLWTLLGSVDAGGGACAMWSDPAGTAVLVTATSD